MRVTRIFVEQKLVSGKGVGLPEQAGLHLTRVLRLEPGAEITLFDGTGGEYRGTLERDGKKWWAKVGAHDPVERESPLSITLLQGVARGERMDLIVQKATELGVARILPVLTERSLVKLDAAQRARKREHWQSIAIAACEQCGRNRVPEVADAIAMGDAVRALASDAARYLLAAGAPVSLAEATRRDAGKPIALLIGPEGGLADGERQFAGAHGFAACSMGPRVLRTETAGFTALAIMQTVAGDFS
jgi:16S rRNA (uracil1498-N3)-methyltransferase